VIVVLDTNHFRGLVEKGAAGRRLLRRIDDRCADVFTCIPATEETLRGWLALLSRHTSGPQQINAYLEFQRSLKAIAQFTILPFDKEAAVWFSQLRREFPRSGTMDLKIASICLAHNATLLSRNLKDFARIPGLLVENWLD
jgi:tRNA(fMet)-specific endonuclease VapC